MKEKQSFIKFLWHFYTDAFLWMFKGKVINIGVVIIGLLIILGLRWFWAEIFYQDWRCTFAECRLMK